MKKILNIAFRKIFTFTLFAFVFSFGMSEAKAHDSLCFKDVEKPFYRVGTGGTGSEALENKKKELQTLLNEMNAFCKELQKAGLREETWNERHEAYYINQIVGPFLNEHPDLKNKYEEFQARYHDAQQAIEKQRDCDTNPYACMEKTDRDATAKDLSDAKNNCVKAFEALKQCGGSASAHDPCSQHSACDTTPSAGSCNSGSVETFKSALSEMCKLGKKMYGDKYGTLHMVNYAATVEGDYYAYAPTSAWRETDLAKAYRGSEGSAGYEQVLADERLEADLTNKECDIEEQKNAYLGTCYSCTIVANLIRVFMNAAAKTAPLTQEAGVKLLVIGMILWFGFFVLQKISSFVSIEPMKMLQELFTFLFKCAVVYTVITSGLLNIINLMVNPILTAGADYGIAMIDTVSDVDLDYTSVDQKQYKVGSGELINQKVFDKIMGISKKADAAMSINFVIGNAIMCHSTHAGSIVIAKKVTDTMDLPPFHFPNFWLWICGALIWFFAFMVTMGINFYLLDLSFKIGFALLALPITLGLYPFNKFKNKFTDCLKIIVNAAGTFMFLGITAAISIVLISSALGGTEQLFDAVKADNKDYISQRFAITGSSFLLILFAFLYSHKLISETVSRLVDKFFGSITSGMNVMNEKTTQMVDFAKKTAMAAAATVLAPIGGAAAGAAKKAAGTVAKGAARTVVKGAMKLGRVAGRKASDGGSEG